MSSSETTPHQLEPLHLTPATIAALPTTTFPTPTHGTVTWKTLFSSPATQTTSLCAGIATCAPHTGYLSLHRHTQAELYHVIEGEGVVTIDGVEHFVESGSVLWIPGDAEHGVRNVGVEELRWLYVFPGGAFGDVVYRFSNEGVVEG